MFPPRGGRRGGGGGGPGGGRGGRGGGGDRGGGGRGGGGGGGGFPPQDGEVVFGNGQFPPPDPGITKMEDGYIQQKSTVTSSMATLSLEQDFPLRPAYGTKGKSVTLWANYFNLTPSKDVALFRYHVSISPEVKGRKLKRIFELLIEHPSLVGAVTDFKSLLITRTRVEDMELAFPYRSELEDEPQADSSPYRAKIQGTGVMEVGALLAHVHSAQPDPNFSSEKKMQIVQALNILLGHYPQSNSTMSTIGANKHYSFGTKPEICELGGGFVALRGYFRSVRLGTGRMLVNINVSHAVFFKPGPLVELINAFAAAYGRNSVQLEKFLKKVRVETTHLKVKENKAGQRIPRVKTIYALANTNDGARLPNPPQIAKFAANPAEVKFWYDPNSQNTSSKPAAETAAKPAAKKSAKKAKDPGKASGRYITVFEFFQTVHHLTIQSPQIPVLNVGNKENPMYMPAEYCMVLPGQCSTKKLSPEQTASMIRFACRKPALNARSITSNGLEALGLLPGSKSPLNPYGINVDVNMITVQGRILNAPSIKYGGNSSETPRYGSWNMAKVKFTQSAPVPAWTSLWVKKASRPGQVERNGLFDPILSEFHNMMKVCGLSAPAPIRPGPVINLDARNAAQTNDQLIDSIMKAIAAKQPKIGMVFVLLPDTDTAIYNKIKYAGDIVYGIHTVCCVDPKISKDRGRDQYLANVALKVNCKMGGVNQSLDMSKLGIIAEGKTMVVGIDVTHPSPGSLSNAPSVAAVVASTDRLLSQFPCELRIQEGRKEMVTDLTEMFQSRLNVWKAKNKTLPENILVYRDGVSEGQYQVLKDTEIPCLRKACELTYPADQIKKKLPKISVIVVGKRHHTRFYGTKENEIDRSTNPINGTVVDRGVTSMWNWDFFLQAHTCLQGTAKPAHYYVVLDEIFGKGDLKKPHPYPNAADTLEDLTHNMCYLFARATKAVSFCPPAYYADLACERARCYLSGVFDPDTSGGSSVTGMSQNAASASDVKIHPNLQKSMFYI